ncbi:MAG: HD domain-containing protein [Candidatus Aenigmarchaeota archaeon]|nr:HD domain-containing protein [Candidatus Aenigmarchaeota archaeon]
MKDKPKLKDLIELAEKIKDKDLREKTIELLKDPKLSNNWEYKATNIERVPAWIGAHHDYAGGLIEHTLSVTELSIMAANYLKERYDKKINMDFVIAGALLHDIGKLFEMREENNEFKFNEFLIDHIRLGGSELYARGFPEEVVHIVFAHAGGDVPRTIEAKIVDIMDNLDSTVESFGKETHSLIYLLGDSLNV